MDSEKVFSHLEFMQRLANELRLQKAFKTMAEIPNLIAALVIIRKTGKMDFEQEVVEAMYRSGVLERDERGYFLSEAAETVVDEYLKLENADAAR
jgi:hypothetical protein